jgi:Domain of unkown function (DUF1775)
MVEATAGEPVHGNLPTGTADYVGMNRLRTRVCVAIALAGLAVGFAVFGAASPALAHTEAEMDNPQAGATNVTLTMTSEAESEKAGIVSVRVVLPDGIAPSQITLVSAPTGWTLTQGSDGYTVGGPALKVHTDAKQAVRIAQLPATATVLVFKTLVTYANGQVDRWIEPPSAANPKPANPAPTVTLRPAAVVATSEAPAPTTAAAAPTTAGATVTATKPGGGSSLPWVISGIVVLIAAVAGAVLLRRGLRGPRDQ